MKGLRNYWYELMIFLLLFPIVNFLVLLGFTDHLLLGKILLGIFSMAVFGSYFSSISDQAYAIIDIQIADFKEKREKIKKALR